MKAHFYGELEKVNCLQRNEYRKKGEFFRTEFFEVPVTFIDYASQMASLWSISTSESDQ